MSPESDEKIGKAAYEIWDREGRPHGRDLDHWDEAARQVENVTGSALRQNADPAAAGDRAATTKAPAASPKPPSPDQDAKGG